MLHTNFACRFLPHVILARDYWLPQLDQLDENPKATSNLWVHGYPRCVFSMFFLHIPISVADSMWCFFLDNNVCLWIPCVLFFASDFKLQSLLFFLATTEHRSLILALASYLWGRKCLEQSARAWGGGSGTEKQGSYGETTSIFASERCSQFQVGSYYLCKWMNKIKNGKHEVKIDYKFV